MCFQNLLLGGPVIVVLEKHSPRKCRLFSPAEDVSWGGKNVFTRRKTNVGNTFPVFTVEPVELNDTKYLRR